MPNRIIKETIKTSDNIDQLSWFEEVVFYRLIVTADDYGCLDGRSIVLRNELFPTKDNVSKGDIEKAIAKLESVGLIGRYASDGRTYLFMKKWENHQRVRNKHRRFPMPTDDNLLSANCGQMSADCLSESNPIQSESNPNIYSAVDEVIDYLNEKAHTNYRHSDTSRKHIKARLNDGFSVDDCKTVIDKKCAEWLGNDMEKYLRPETLFGSKFENYLNAPLAQKKAAYSPHKVDAPDYMSLDHVLEDLE